MILDLFDSNITDQKAQIFNSSIPSIESLHTDGKSIVNLDILTGPDCLSELYLDMKGDDFRGDLMNFLQISGLHLSRLELKKMRQPVDICQMSILCPNLKRIKVKLLLQINNNDHSCIKFILLVFDDIILPNTFSGSFDWNLVGQQFKHWPLVANEKCQHSI